MKKTSFIALSLLSGIAVQSCVSTKGNTASKPQQPNRKFVDEDDVYYRPPRRTPDSLVVLQDSLRRDSLLPDSSAVADDNSYPYHNYYGTYGYNYYYPYRGEFCYHFYYWNSGYYWYGPGGYYGYYPEHPHHWYGHHHTPCAHGDNRGVVYAHRRDVSSGRLAASQPHITSVATSGTRSQHAIQGQHATFAASGTKSQHLSHSTHATTTSHSSSAVASNSARGGFGHTGSHTSSSAS